MRHRLREHLEIGLGYRHGKAENEADYNYQRKGAGFCHSRAELCAYRRHRGLGSEGEKTHADYNKNRADEKAQK